MITLTAVGLRCLNYCILLYLEILESEYVQYGDDGLDRLARGLAADDLVEPGHQPREQRRVQRLRDGVPRV